LITYKLDWLGILWVFSCPPKKLWEERKPTHSEESDAELLPRMRCNYKVFWEKFEFNSR